MKKKGGNVLSPDVLVKRLRSIRRGKKIVFTNGCFDLFHVGHLKVLTQAKRHGDLLVVALNSDASVQRLKGKNRPILSLKDRAELMAGLKPVDFVTYFKEDTPLKTIQKIKPDILIKGGDWSTDSIVGKSHVKRVVRVPLVKGRSTTSIIKSIVRNDGKS